MRQEILQARGQLAEYRRQSQDLVTEAKGLIVLIRNVLNPFEPDPAMLRIPEAAANMRRLVELHARLHELRPLIQELEQALEALAAGGR